jgi:hypothetical protein
LLMDGGDKSLRSYPEAARKRLFEKGVEACRCADHDLHSGLKALLAGFQKSDRSYSELAMGLVRHLLAAGQEEEAKKILKRLVVEHPRFHLPARWLERLERPRIDRFALENPDEPLADVMYHHRRYVGHALDTMKPVWVQVANPDHLESHERVAEILAESCVAGVAPLLGRGVTNEGDAWFAIPNSGPPITRSLEHKGGLGLAEAIGVCCDVTIIFASLAAAGLEIPDSNPARFARGSGGGLLLIDLTGAERADEATAVASQLGLAREFCLDVLNRAQQYLAPDTLPEEITSAASFAELAQLFERSPHRA